MSAGTYEDSRGTTREVTDEQPRWSVSEAYLFKGYQSVDDFTLPTYIRVILLVLFTIVSFFLLILSIKFLTDSVLNIFRQNKV